MHCALLYSVQYCALLYSGVQASGSSVTASQAPSMFRLLGSAGTGHSTLGEGGGNQILQTVWQTKI
jgi:hypothetical protein